MPGRLPQSLPMIVCALLLAGAAPAAAPAETQAQTPARTPVAAPPLSQAATPDAAPAAAPATGTAPVTDLSQIGPQAPAKSIRAARGALLEPALEFTIKTSGGGGAGTRTVDLARDFTVDYGDMSGTLYDYALRRVVALDDTRKSFRNTSLYALVDFFVHETVNRRFERGALGSLKVKDAGVVDPFWVQSELHVMDPQDGAPAIVRKQAKDGSVHFSYAGKEVASYTLSKQSIGRDESAALARYLRMSAALHPTIVDEIAASGRLPARIVFALPPLLKKPRAEWTFSAGTRVKAVYPLRDGVANDMLPASDPRTGALAALLPVMQAAIAGTAPGHRTIADFRAAIAAAMKDGKLFRAALLGFELHEEYGPAGSGCGADAPSGCRSVTEVFL
ncbi:MAG: hypothetical protein ACREHE_16910, partial [Rhizomicrobium sp.]